MIRYLLVHVQEGDVIALGEGENFSVLGEFHPADRAFGFDLVHFLAGPSVPKADGFVVRTAQQQGPGVIGKQNLKWV